MSGVILNGEEVAARLGVEPWRVYRGIQRGFVKAPVRTGRMMLFGPDELPAIKAALIRAGYLSESEPVGG